MHTFFHVHERAFACTIRTWIQASMQFFKPCEDNQMNKLIEEHGSRTKPKFLHGKFLEAQSEVTDMHEQLMEELVLNDSLFNNDWIASKQTESQIF